MSVLEIFLIGVSLSMDAFAVSLCKGLSMKELNVRSCLIIGLYFGLFQGIMPLIGYYLGETFESTITSIDHWATFIMLLIVGINMIRETLSNEVSTINDEIDFKTMIPLAIATSIDALAVGITFSFFEINIFASIILIALTTFTLSVIGTYIGNKFGSKYSKVSSIIGGIILIILGTKILFEHLGLI